MNGWSRDKINSIIATNISQFHNRCKEIDKIINENFEDTIDYLNTLVAQISGSVTGPLIPKTPKALRKKGICHIETILENEVMTIESTLTNTIAEDSKVEDEEVTTGRTRRAASKRAADSIRKQQSYELNAKSRKLSNVKDNLRSSKSTRGSRSKKPKALLNSSGEEDENNPTLRKPSKGEDIARTNKSNKRSRSKRPKAVTNSSDEEDETRPVKHIKVEKILPKRSTLRSASTAEVTSPLCTSKNEQDFDRLDFENEQVASVKRKHEEVKSISPLRSDRKSTCSQEPASKKTNIIDETIDRPSVNDTLEVSMYEDAICKSIPIMSSTMYCGNTTVTLQKNTKDMIVSQEKSTNSTYYVEKSDAILNNKNKIMNMTVVLDHLPPQMQINKTIVLEGKSTGKSNSRGNSTINDAIQENDKVCPVSSCSSPKLVVSSKNTLQDRRETLKETAANADLNALITDDESSPENRIPEEKAAAKQHVKLAIHKASEFYSASLLSEEDEVLCTPAKTVLREINGVRLTKDIKSVYKSNALFSPYAKDSVKKRVEAFEQAGINSPQPVDIDAPVRMTRTKTRALAAAAAESGVNKVQTLAQKLARKSLVKAKKISLAKQMKENEDCKENQNMGSAQKISRLLTINEKLIQKQQRVTPIGKNRLHLPMSVNRIMHTPCNAHILPNSTKAMSTSRANIVTGIESFIQSKSTQKLNSIDKMDEKRRKAHEDDVRRKREEALKAQTEEKRRKREEKELKNKLAREAKEKQDMEKRLKLEKEREEKARLALQMQEKQREEAEKKRLAQLQRAQEKEERRKQEEQMRLQRIQEQEEAERQLAEQKKRKEQEAERRKLAEARAQEQQAAYVAAKLKAQHLAAQAKMKQACANNHKQAPLNYVIDSEPDDDVSDDETNPKHDIPYWAMPNVRKAQLNMQQYIPIEVVQSLFGSRKCTPDLTDLFHGIDKSRLKRTSSAIWKTPPRYSMMDA